MFEEGEIPGVTAPSVILNLRHLPAQGSPCSAGMDMELRNTGGGQAGMDMELRKARARLGPLSQPSRDSPGVPHTLKTESFQGSAQK